MRDAHDYVDRLCFRSTGSLGAEEAIVAGIPALTAMLYRRRQVRFARVLGIVVAVALHLITYAEVALTFRGGPAQPTEQRLTATIVDRIALGAFVGATLRYAYRRTRAAIDHPTAAIRHHSARLTLRGARRRKTPGSRRVPDAGAIQRTPREQGEKKAREGEGVESWKLHGQRTCIIAKPVESNQPLGLFPGPIYTSKAWDRPPGV